MDTSCFSTTDRVSACGDGNGDYRLSIDNKLLFGLRQLTCGLPAFVNCTADTLTGDLVSFFSDADGARNRRS